MLAGGKIVFPFFSSRSSLRLRPFSQPAAALPQEALSVHTRPVVGLSIHDLHAAVVIVSPSFAFSNPLWPPVEKRALISTPIWIPEDVYEGQTFFDNWDFFNFDDPTHGSVIYVNRNDAFSKGLARVTHDNKVVMQMDNTSWLADGGKRDSVRISSQKRYDGGLFILDLNRAPWGCSVWPAFWTVGDNWPNNGEIDVFEGVHDNTHDQITWHTAAGCNLMVPGNFSGTPSSHTACGSSNDDNAGCAVIEWSRASYGPQFDALNGGVYVMKWDEESISVWFFYRASIPTDIVQGEPNPSGWGIPSATLARSGCNITQYFKQHQIVFDITTCGDWAGSSYATSGCPGSCGATVQNPANFVNASWIINSLRVYKKTIINTIHSSESTSFGSKRGGMSILITLIAVIWSTL